jgi:NDP-sugar pyrophosphorylase family protein/thiamine kinase-like enzyme
MKALILAAGFGTRLLPYTQAIPKPLFTLLSKPMLEHTIQKLVDSGCEQILINTHHLQELIQSFVQQSRYSDIIQAIYEPVILDTGGAIANAEPFLKESAFFVINSDIISDIDLKKVYKFHESSNCLATLVLHDHDKFNKITIDNSLFIQNFNATTNGFAFTGVQVLSPQIFDCFPGQHNKSDRKIFSSIEVYKKLCKEKEVKAFVDTNIFWSDMGTCDSYSKTSLLLLAATQFKIDQKQIKNIQVDKLAGDGSDRKWYRATYEDKSFIISDHGICLPHSDDRLQLNAFINIGNHLASKFLTLNSLSGSKTIPVPRIYTCDKLSGMVILEDLGDLHLETIIKEKSSDRFTIKLYKKVIDELINFSFHGFSGFKKEWTCQTQTYSRELILEKECRYFIEEFIQNYLKINLSFNDLSKEFDYVAKHALEHGLTGLMHRDMQSRNIMVNNTNDIYSINFIDFQGARSGPLQYDLASLLIDPYINLKDQIRDDLLQYVIEKLKLNQDESFNFLKCYQYCCLTRNMQFLGAFSFLSQAKKKKSFEQYIPVAVKSLKEIIKQINIDKKIPKLSKLVQSI